MAPERTSVADGDSVKELLVAVGAQGDNSKQHLSAAVGGGPSGGVRRKLEQRDGEKTQGRQEVRR
jgi:hypothetical protein